METEQQEQKEAGEGQREGEQVKEDLVGKGLAEWIGVNGGGIAGTATP